MRGFLRKEVFSKAQKKTGVWLALLPFWTGACGGSEASTAEPEPEDPPASELSTLHLTQDSPYGGTGESPGWVALQWEDQAWQELDPSLQEHDIEPPSADARYQPAWRCKGKLTLQAATLAELRQAWIGCPHEEEEGEDTDTDLVTTPIPQATVKVRVDGLQWEPENESYAVFLHQNSNPEDPFRLSEIGINAVLQPSNKQASVEGAANRTGNLWVALSRRAAPAPGDLEDVTAVLQYEQLEPEEIRVALIPQFTWQQDAEIALHIDETLLVQERTLRGFDTEASASGEDGLLTDGELVGKELAFDGQKPTDANTLFLNSFSSEDA